MEECITVPARLDKLDAVVGFVADALEAQGFSPRASIPVQVAVEELFVNIAHYAYAPSEGEATIVCRYSEALGEFSVEFIDSGLPYDPLAKPDPDVTLSAEEREIGGLGILMVKKSMDRMEYRYEGGCNRLLIVKKR